MVPPILRCTTFKKKLLRQRDRQSGIVCQVSWDCPSSRRSHSLCRIGNCRGRQFVLYHRFRAGRRLSMAFTKIARTPWHCTVTYHRQLFMSLLIAGCSRGGSGCVILGFLKECKRIVRQIRWQFRRFSGVSLLCAWNSR